MLEVRWRGQRIHYTTCFPAKRTLLAGSSTQTRCVEYYYIISRRDIGEAGATSFKCMVRYSRTEPALSTQHGLDIGWSATCDRGFTIVVHINVVMSYGSSHVHAMLNTKQTWCWSTPWVFHLKPLFQRVLAHTMHALTIHSREIQTMWLHNHDAGSYETLCEVDSNSGDVVIYWTMTGTHVVPDRQHYDEHTYSSISSTPSVRADYSSLGDTSSMITSPRHTLLWYRIPSRQQ